MSADLKMPKSKKGERYAPVPNQPGYAVRDDGTFWTCWQVEYADALSKPHRFMDDTNWRELRPSAGKKGTRGSLSVRIDGKSLGAAKTLLRAFKKAPEAGRGVARYLDGDRSNLALSNLAWEPRTEAESCPDPSINRRYFGTRPRKSRTCLRCSKSFKSWGPANRRCPACEQRLERSGSSSRDEPVRMSTG